MEFKDSTEGIQKVMLPEDCRVGDVLSISDNKITVDKTETMKSKEELHDLMNEFFERLAKKQKQALW